MLSRRRSSEQVNATEALRVVPPTPTHQRLQNALRNATVLFSVVAQLDPSAIPLTASETASAQLPRSAHSRKPDFSGDLGLSNELSGMRRLFGRERRRGIPPTAPDSRPVYRLVVSSSTKHREQIRLHQIIDGGFGSRVSVYRSWPLSDLRKIDGLGRPVAESLHFALYFSSSARALAWRTENSPARAIFLWSLLQTCVSRLSRAPPVINLRLLDLQTTAENAEPGYDKPSALAGDGRDEKSSGTFKDSMRLASSLGELGLQRSPEFPRPATPMSDSSVKRPLSPRIVPPPKLSVKDSSGETKATPSKNTRQKHHSSEQQNGNLLGSGELDPDSGETEHRDVEGTRKSDREVLKTQRVKRTLSEPKASALFAGAEDDSGTITSDERPQKADTIAPGQTAVEQRLKELNIDERAFLAAAKRLGAKRSFEMKHPDHIDGVSTTGSDPKARLFQNRLKMSEANTRKVVAERKMLQERMLFKLSEAEQGDLTFAMNMFCEEKKDETLQDFGAWVSSRIQSLEVENISDLVSVEKQMIPNGSIHEPVTDHKNLNDLWERMGGGTCSYDVLVESMTSAEPWLEKCQTLLAPYAEFAEDVNIGVSLLETQRKNALDLDGLLTELINALSFEYSERSLVDGIGTFDLSFDVSELDTDDIQSAVEIIAAKVDALAGLSALSEMSAKCEVEKLLSQRQKEASNLLLPILKDYVDKIYESCSSADLAKRICPDALRSKDFSSRKDFASNVRRLSSFGTASWQIVIDQYVRQSSEWISDTVKILNVERHQYSTDEMGTLSSVRQRKTRELTSVNEQFAENLFCVCIIEGSRACDLFREACEYDSANCEKMSLSSLLRKQVPDDSILGDSFMEGSKADPVLVACVHQHASQVFERFADNLKLYEDGFSTLELGHVSSLFNKSIRAKEAVLSWVAAEQAQYFPLPSECNNAKGRDDNDYLQSIRPETIASKEQFSHNLTDVLSNFVDVCRCIALQCRSVTESHVKATLSSLENKRDLTTELGRKEFFSCVSMAVDLGCVLSSPDVLDGSSESSNSSEIVKYTCERLISAAMKGVQVSIQGCSESICDKVKLQNYGYIATKLAECETPDFLHPLCHLATRVRKHVIERWLERQPFSSLDGFLRLEASRRFPGVQQSHTHSSLPDLDVGITVADVRVSVKRALESASESDTTEMLYRDTMTGVRVAMEEALKIAERDQVDMATRAKLVAFAKELKAALKSAATERSVSCNI